MEAVAKYKFTASQDDELSFEKGSVLNILDKDEDRNWYKAEQNDQEGWIPNTYITMRPHRTGDHVQHFKIFKNEERKYYLWIRKFSSLNMLVEHHKTNSVSNNQQIFLSDTDLRDEMVQALFNFAAQDTDELSFTAGQWITVLDKSNPDWWKGQVNGAIGIFPSNYVTAPTPNQT
ncbi:hypothetical protein pdam_00010909 [Pocillopora damicornis]|uniref:SH3 domain-containing protein n=1 Tax=Pocillopora damicornis TaxID=46731 RepID=A0A3M6TAF0_POCDA|nr:hypothetical protein pdam_00010909 [Pocillopora damicornis]